MTPTERYTRLCAIVDAASVDAVLEFSDNSGGPFESIDEARVFVVGALEQSMIEDGPDGPCPNLETAAALLGVTW